MSNSAWAIRMYLPFDEENSVSFVGSFETAGSRYLDKIKVFSGLYGMPDFMLWYMHKDLVSYNFSNYSLELKLYLRGDIKDCYWKEKYRVISVYDDLEKDMKVVYAIQEGYALLDSLLIDANIGTLDYKETRDVEQLLRDVLEVTGIIPVIFCEHSDFLKQSFKFEYPNFTLDPSWTVRDFIQYVANENNFEWTIKYGMLFIGPILPTYGDFNATKELINRQVDNFSKYRDGAKIAFAASPLNVLWSYLLQVEDQEIDMRCVWAKHIVGVDGDLTKGCFVPTAVKIDKETYYHSLEENQERILAVEYIFKDVKFNQIRIGRVTKDEGDNEYVDEVSIEKSTFQYSKKTPRNVPMNVTTPVYTLPRVGRTTPYLDDRAGLFFPRTNNIHTNPNQLLFAVNDRIEQSVLGPFVMGNGSPAFLIPSKNPDDFRFQLPNGWCLYIKDDGETYLQIEDTDSQSIPSEDTTKPFLHLKPDGTIKINANNNIELKSGDFGIYVEADDEKIRLKYGDNNIAIYGSSNRILLTADDRITLKTGENTLVLKTTNVVVTVGSNTFTIDSSKVEMVAGASKATLTTAGLDVT